MVLSTGIAYLCGPASMICYYRVNLFPCCRNILGEKTTQSSNAGPTTRSGGGGGGGGGEGRGEIGIYLFLGGGGAERRPHLLFIAPIEN